MGKGRKKRYVQVDAIFTPEGELLPRCIYWENGRRFEIDKILEHRPAASLKVGGAGERYNCMILGEPKFLFYEPEGGKVAGRWFVEERCPADV